MHLLLDTHVLLWVAMFPDRMSAAAMAAVASPLNRLWFSAVSVWEIAYKDTIEKLVLTSPLEQFLFEQQAALDCAELPLRQRHAFVAARLPKIHRDPADRFLIAQAMVEGLTLVTADELIRQYDVPTLW